MDKNIIETISNLITTPKKIAIITHSNPDGDALGSSLALYGILVQQKHDVKVITPNEFPSFLAWMPFSSEIIIHKTETETAAKVLSEADIIFCLDFNDLSRIENIEADYTKSKATKILIDHHLDPSKFTDFTISVSNSSSTSEIIFNVIADLNLNHLLTKEIAECIYTGIITDTGSLSFSCNNINTYHVVAELFKTGIDGEHIHRLVYDTYSEDRMRLLGFCLSEKLKVIHKYHTAFISLTKKELERFNFKIGDTEGVVNFALSMDGITMAVLFMERKDYIKISLRSKGNVSVNDIARKYYSGGGHHNAAGGSSFVNMNETIEQFEKILPTLISA